MANMNATAKKDAVKGVLVPGTTYYLSMATATPGTTGTHEGVSITRGAIKFGTPTATGKQKSSTAATVKVGTKAKYPYLMVWTAATGGTCLWSGTNTSTWKTTTVPATTTVKFAAGTVSAKIS